MMAGRSLQKPKGEPFHPAEVLPCSLMEALFRYPQPGVYYLGERQIVNIVDASCHSWEANSSALE